MARRLTSLSRALLVAALLVTTAIPLGAQPSVEDGFDPLVSRVRNRPATAMATDNYVYGPDTGFMEPELALTIQDNSYSEPATLYVYWHNRDDGSQLFANVSAAGVTGGLTVIEVDFFGSSSRPRRINVDSLEAFKLLGQNSVFGPGSNLLPMETGRYQFVMEIRDAEGKDVIARSNTFYNIVDGVVVRSGESTGETWSADNLYVVDGSFNVTGGTLEIEPGTVVMGGHPQSRGDGTLIIERGAKIDAVGKPLDPIVFTSGMPPGRRSPGDWNGLVISGAAPTNLGSDPQGKFGSGAFGGNDGDDSSGGLAYARVEYAGVSGDEGDDLGAIVLQGVGRGTRLDHVQVHQADSDGIEVVGGTADAKFLYVSGARDESLEWQAGWQGQLQFLVANQCGRRSHDKGIEGLNEVEGSVSSSPTSRPEVRNATLIGDGDSSSFDSAALLETGTEGAIQNSVLMFFSGAGVEFDDETADNLTEIGDDGNPVLDIDNNIISQNSGGLAEGAPDDDLGDNTITADPDFLNDPIGREGCGVVPDLTFDADPALPSATGSFFDPAPFAGAIDADDPWINLGFLVFSDE